MEADAPQVRLPLSSLYLVAFVDSAGGRVGTTSRSKNARSRSAIVVLGQDELTRLFVLKAWARHCTTDELIDEIFKTQLEWHPAVFGIDASGNQGLFADALIREAREKGKKLPLTKQAMETDKDFRIETTLQPLQSAGRLFAQEDMLDLRGEYEAFPGSQMKDLLDAFAGAIKLMPVRATGREVIDEQAQYATYLRSCRVPESEIERRLQSAR